MVFNLLLKFHISRKKYYILTIFQYVIKNKILNNFYLVDDRFNLQNICKIVSLKYFNSNL